MPSPSRIAPPLVWLLLLAGCADDATSGGPRIDALDPSPAAPGEVLLIDGERFGDGGYVAIGGRPLPGGAVDEWTGSRIQVALPEDLAAGPTLVVVVAEGRASPPAPLEVAGDPVSRDRPRRFPPRRDGGPGRDGGVDGGPRDGGSDTGRPPPDAGNPSLRAEFTADPAGDDHVRLIAQPSGPGELVLEVHLPAGFLGEIGGVALHVAHDGNLLQLVEVRPGNSDLFLGGELSRDRVAFGRVFPGNTQPIAAVLRFAVVGRGEARVELPTRHRTVRDRANRAIPRVRWAGGSVRVVEVAR